MSGPRGARLGQHFLTDHGIARRIAALVPEAAATIVEIGPGRGILTGALLDRFPRLSLHAIEIDADLCRNLRSRFAGRLQLRAGDALALKLEEIPGRPLFLAGNLPYGISKELIDLVIAQQREIAGCVFMLQKAFVEKILGRPGRANAQSLMLGVLFSMRLEFTVRPGSFRPAPRVLSAVVSLEKKRELPAFPHGELYDFLKACFASPRKTLLNNLAARHADKPIAALLARHTDRPAIRPAEAPAELFLSLFESLG